MHCLRNSSTCLCLAVLTSQLAEVILATPCLADCGEPTASRVSGAIVCSVVPLRSIETGCRCSIKPCERRLVGAPAVRRYQHDCNCPTTCCCRQPREYPAVPPRHVDPHWDSAPATAIACISSSPSSPRLSREVRPLLRFATGAARLCVLLCRFQA